MAIQALYPDTRPTLDLNFARAKRLDPRITFSRLSTGTYIGSDGLLKTAIANVARFDHDPITGESLGLLVEAAGTNLVLHNRDLTQAQWTKTNMTVARDQIGPDGIGNSASSIIADADRATVLQAITSASSARLTSAYVKRISGTGPIEMTQNGGLNWTAVPITASWTRVSIPSATIVNPTVGFRIGAIGDAIAVDYVQCESNFFSTSAIATTSATVTRSADVASITEANFRSWYQQDEGTMLSDALMTSQAAGADYWTITANTGISNSLANFAIGLQCFMWCRFNGTNQVNSSIGTLAFQSRAQIAYAFKTNDFSSSLNGASVITDASGVLPISMANINFGHTAVGNNIGGGQRQQWIRRLAYWPTRLSNATLQSLTR
jgi:hypothetical protein